VGGVEQIEFAGMPARLYPCTPTRLVTWLDCPRRYRFSYLERPMPPKGAPWAHNSVGAAVHSALADWFNLPHDRRVPSAGAGLVRRRWLTDGFRDGDQSARARERAVEYTVEYLRTMIGDAGSALGGSCVDPVGVERTVSTKTRSLVLSGRVDRIDDRPGTGLVIVDYKTGRHEPDSHDARSSLALAVYALATARTLRRSCSTVELHHLPSGTVAVAEHAPEGLERKVREAESIARDSAAADAAYRAGDRSDELFPPSTSRGCSWCDFRRHCPEGRAAAPDVEPWAGLAAEVA
jgi:putative RecB family exonuclease